MSGVTLSDKFLDRLDELSLAMRDHARGGAGGVRRSRTLGSSAEFSDFREYAPGDDIRRIDWNAYARFDKLFLKLFMEQREAVLTLLIDDSQSMGFQDKWPCAMKLCLTLSYIALRGGDRVRIVTLSQTTPPSPLYSGRADYARVNEYIARIAPAGRLDLNGALLRASVGSKGLCAVVSDLLNLDGFEKGLMSLLFRKQELTVSHILSREELQPGMTGALRLIDSENGGNVDIMMGADALNAYKRELNALILSARGFANKRGALYALIPSDIDFEREALKSLSQAGIIA